MNNGSGEVILGSQNIGKRRNSFIYKTKKPTPGIIQKGLRDRQG